MKDRILKRKYSDLIIQASLIIVTKKMSKLYKNINMYNSKCNQ